MDQATDLSFNALTSRQVRVRIVDVGAAKIGGDPVYRDLLAAGNADIVGFEPNPEELTRLQEAKGPNETYLPYAVADGQRHRLHICFAPGMNSLLPPNRDVLDLFHGFPYWGLVTATQEIDTVRLDDVAECAGADLLKLDIQGAELMALQHAEQLLRDLLVIHCEVEFVPIYEGQPLFSEVEEFLRRQGFMFHRFFPQISRTFSPLTVHTDPFAGLSQLVWADAIFIRDITRLERLTSDQLLTMAAMVHDCYQSYDLALRLIGEHDRRSGGRLGEVYLAGLQLCPVPN